MNINRVTKTYTWATWVMKEIFLISFSLLSLICPLADGGLLVVARDVVPDDAVRVEVVEDSNAELGLAAVAQLVAVVRLGLLVPPGKRKRGE